MVGRREVGGEAVRLQVHALGHVVAPRRHRLAEDAGNARRAQMGGKRKAVRSGADNGDIADVGHDILLKQKEHGANPVFRNGTRLSFWNVEFRRFDVSQSHLHVACHVQN